jgi:hypothetical protein
MRPPARRVTSKNDSVFRKYQKEARQLLKDQNYPTQLQAAYASLTHPPPKALLEQINILDRIKSDALAVAEQRFQKLTMGEIAYSPQIGVLHKRMKLWGTLHAHLQVEAPIRKNVFRLGHLLGHPNPYDVTSLEAAKSMSRHG